VRKQVAGASPRPVPDRLAVVLRRGQTAEQGATGAQRIPALRLTRYLIAGVRYAGYTNARVAECLGISPDAVRARGSSDGWVAVDDFAAVAHLGEHAIEQWATDKLLQHTAMEQTGRRYYAASELVRALDRFGDDPEAEVVVALG
jgi:hypothetical protein